MYGTTIFLNNQGAQHLQNSRFFKAAKSFHQGLDAITAAMVDHAKDNDDDHNKSMRSFKIRCDQL